MRIEKPKGGSKLVYGNRKVGWREITGMVELSKTSWSQVLTQNLSFFGLG